MLKLQSCIPPFNISQEEQKLILVKVYAALCRPRFYPTFAKLNLKFLNGLDLEKMDIFLTQSRLAAFNFKGPDYMSIIKFEIAFALNCFLLSNLLHCNFR